LFDVAQLSHELGTTAKNIDTPRKRVRLAHCVPSVQLIAKYI